MKILMVLEGEFPPDGRVEKEIQSLEKDGHCIDIACFSKGKNEQDERTNYGTIFRKKISTFQYKSSIGALKLPFYFNYWKRFLTKLCNSTNYDVIHIHDLPLTRIGIKLKKKFDLKLVVDLHENYPSLLEYATHTKKFLARFLYSNKQWRKYEKDALPHADSIITVVDEMKNRIANLGIEKDIIHVVSNTVSINNFNLIQRSPDKQGNLFVYVGGLNFHRGIQHVFDGMKELLSRNIETRFIIVGDGSYKKTLEKRVNELGIQKLVNFVGWKNYDEISQYLSIANYALIPHIKYEQTDNSSPNKIFEYMWNELPIISSNCDSLVRIIRETKSGITYEFDSPKDFADKFIELRNNTEKYFDATNAKKIIEQKYNWSVDEKSLIKIYRSIK